MNPDRADLYIQRDDLAGNEERFEKVLKQVPGVQDVRFLPDGPESIARRVEVTFDPSQTNPVAFHQTLADAGFTVLSAHERGNEDV
jgi:copper chaperone CopZ